MRDLERRLDELRRGGRDSVSYGAPTADEEPTFRAWIRDAGSRAERGDAPPSHAPNGFVLREVEGFWLLSESLEQRRGAGALVLRVGAAFPVVVESPHTFFDSGTLPIGLGCFDRTHARALLINTVHRYRTRAEGAEEGQDEPTSIALSDVAHAERSFFLFAHEELQELASQPAVVQLHGFRDETAGSAEVVLSASGTKADSATPASALRRMLGPERVAVYPTDTNKLGGMTNVEGSSSRRRNRSFLHVEIARSLRSKLTGDKRTLATFVDALFGLAPSP